MAVSNEELQLRDEARTAILEAIKSYANRMAEDPNRAEELAHLATAYVTICEAAKPEKPRGRMVSY